MCCVLIPQLREKWFSLRVPKHEIPLKMSEISQQQKENTNRAHRKNLAMTEQTKISEKRLI